MSTAPMQSRFKWPLVVRAIAFALVLVALLLAARLRTSPQPASGLAMLQDLTTAGGPQIGGARLSGQFSDWRPGGAALQTTKPVRARLLDVYRAIERNAQVAPTPDNRHALGVSQLFIGRLDAAIDSLNSSTQNGSASPSAHNDLAAAYLARARRGGMAGEDYASAYEELARLVFLKRSREPSVLFNRALALEGLENRTAAERAWKEFLQVDASSPWADDARRHLKVLHATIDAPASSAIDGSSTQSICRDPLASRRHVENDLLSRWAETTRNGDDAAAEAVLRQIEQIGEARLTCSGDRSVRETALALRALRDAERRPAADSILSLYAVVERARTEQGKSVGAAYERAMSDARAARLPLDRLAAGLCAFQYYYAGDYAAARRVLDAARRDEARFSTWTAQVHWVDGMLHAVQGSPLESLASYQKALRLYEEAREPRNIAALEMLIAENLTILEDRRQAWTYRLRALSELAGSNDRSRLFYALNEAAEAALTSGRPFVALAYQESAGALAATSGDESERAYHFVWLAMIQDRCGQHGAAAQSIASARDAVTRISSDDVRRRVLADADLAEGFVHQSVDPNRALASWSSALSYFRSVGVHYRAAQLLLARGKTFRRLGQNDHALADFNAGIEELEQQRKRIDQEDLRSSFFGGGADLFDELISLLSHAGNARASYDAAERRRERTLLDAFGGEIRDTTATAATIMAALGEGEVLLQYAVLENEVIRWELRRGGITGVRISASRERLRNTVAALYAERNGKRMSLAQRRALIWLRSILIPSDAALDDATGLIVVPDSALSDVPFAALLDARSGRFLIETHSLEISPSATLFAACRAGERALARSPKAATAFVFGDTRGADARSLPALSGARNELQEVALTLKTSPLLDARATRTEFFRGAPNSDIVYIGGHAVARGSGASRALVIAGDHSESNLLSTDEVRRNRFRSRLVVLAACDTGVAQGEGVTSLARAFLVAGVPAMVASLLPADDRATAALLKPFAGQLLTGRSPAAALREVQLRSLQRDRLANPFRWAGFQLYGSGTLPLRESN